MPLFEGIFASFCAGIGVSLINRFALSQIKTPCERARDDAKDSDDSSDDSGETAAAVAEVHCHHGGAE